MNQDFEFTKRQMRHRLDVVAAFSCVWEDT